ncbi:MAG: capsule biosynthesis protein [Euryarchaeota archaeon RBG_19FT_COMBO_56_21]|nr:MAG: capsule biosynthesis protein [Euryarchaeota archaeon RBG_19FT_COMBO_56_21]
MTRTLVAESSDHILEAVKKTFESEIENTERFVDSIIGARKIFIYGVGRSGLISKAFAIRLVQMGLEVFFVGETITPIVEEENLVIIVSYSGETMSAIQTANIVRRVGAKVITITAHPHSKLAGASSFVIEIHPQKTDESKRLAPLGTLFEIATMVFFEGAVAMLMEKLGQSEGSLRKRHAIWV